MRISGSSTQGKEGHIGSKRYGGPQLSHQNKMLTSNSNHSQQIKFAHSKLQIHHSKYKSLSANTNMVSVRCGLQTTDCRLRTRGKMQTAGKG